MTPGATDAVAVGLGAAALLLLGAGSTRAGAAAGGLALTVLAVGAVLRSRKLAREVEELRRHAVSREGLAAVGLATAGFAHELKNALMVIQGFAALARKTAENGGAPERVASQVTEVESQANRTVEHLRGFLRLVREASGAGEEQQPRPLRTVLEEVAALVGPLARERDVAFELRLGGALDRTVRDPAMRSALLNLGLNAVEHARTRVVLEARGGAGVDVSVTDDGPGVPADVAATLFQPFARGRPGGTGLGLASVRAAVEGEGGTVRHDPTSPHGARFVVHLP